ncbi:hypothetical protein AX17_000159 [Amanita inopinata Kibby_2008]|nr:hypothetical protein AX17_000159 [Amanita inopinata Kibby_2008]
MQPNPSHPSNLSPPIPNPLKRPFSPTSPPQRSASTKIQRLDDSKHASSAASNKPPSSRSAHLRMKPSAFGQANHPPRKPPSGLRPSHPTAHPLSPARPPQKGRAGKTPLVRKPLLEGPFHGEEYITRQYRTSLVPIKDVHISTPKATLGNFAVQATGKRPVYMFTEGTVIDDDQRHPVWRTTVTVHLPVPVIGIGDHLTKKESERLAALSAVYQLHLDGLLEQPRSLHPLSQGVTETKLSDGSSVNHERARNFMDYYCRKFGFEKPNLSLHEVPGSSGRWEAQIMVNDRRIGLGSGPNKKLAQVACYLDVTQYLEGCDAELWKQFVAAERTGADLGLAPKVSCQISDGLADDIRGLCMDIRNSKLYRNRPAPQKTTSSASPLPLIPSYEPPLQQYKHLKEKSKQLLARRREYLTEPRLELMRAARTTLPVFSRSKEIVSHIGRNDVIICVATTGSGKTTQIPQMILDDYVDRAEGAACNVICTQPRRLAAISVAHRVAKERGEPLGKSVGYQVRFEATLPEQHGSITFCTTGVLLRRLQSALSHPEGTGLDEVTHVVVDEVHERDVDTDLLLMVLKRLMTERKARGKPLKVVLMSATINPTLFQKYFADDAGQPAQVIDVPGRSFPVEKKYLEDFIADIVRGPMRWILHQESVTNYLTREMDPIFFAEHDIQVPLLRGATAIDNRAVDDLELPYPLIAATVAHALQHSVDGHVLVFLPGWDEIMATQRALTAPLRPLGLNFNDTSQFSIHLLHSTIPLAEQQLIFEPPQRGVRRIILATNIAETSVTIPDVVYVIDTAKVKEQRYDPDRHMSSLVSAWVGSSNLDQRAGRAGRHRPGTYFGLLGHSRVSALQPYQTVEMKRIDLSNIVMHVKALNFSGMTIEEVLAGTIEPPDRDRVAAAITNLHIVGALDSDNNLTSLGHVLLQLPVDAQMGRLVLYGSLFRCLDQALTLAAILTNREPFVSPVLLKKQANEKKNSWTPEEFRSDVLAALQAYQHWCALRSKGDYSANRFCTDNFLAKPTLLLIEKIKRQLLQSLYHAGVIAVSAKGNVEPSARRMTVPPELNKNGDSLPLLAALIATACQPKFAVRTGERTYRTPQDKVTFMHPGSVNYRKREVDPERGEKQLFSFAEKRRNLSGGTSAQTFLVTTTKLDPMAYMLFGAYKLQPMRSGLECDSWLPIVGKTEYLDDIHRLKVLMADCMLRVYDGIVMGHRDRKAKRVPSVIREEEPEFEDEEEGRDLSMSAEELKDLDNLTDSMVRILNRYHEEQATSQSRQSSRPATPMASPFAQPMRLPSGPTSGYSTPNSYGHLRSSRPGTPSRLSHFF